MPCLEVSGLTKVFSRDGKVVEAIDNLALAVDEGEFVSIVGPSGCGKTTLLHIIGGFEKPTAGRLAVFGREISGPGPDRGVMFQEFSLYPWRTVIGNVGWGLEVRGLPKAERLRIAERYLEMVGLSPFRDHYPAELSGGMKQRVALARTLAFDPKLLLMDEPFGALDAQTREIMQEELQRIYERNRKTVVFVTHDIDEAIYLGDRVLVFSARPGRIKKDVRIDLARPRAIEIKKSIEYHGYRNRIWDLLRDEVVRARVEDP
jgi:NitT/TauT family transport system ATP-binding protein